MRLRTRAILVAACTCLFLFPTVGWSGLTPYSQDFEALDPADPGALAGAGWLVFANVFFPDGSYHYGYGPFPAPNGGPGFSAVVVGEGGPAQGAQQMVVYSDYNNGDHNFGKLIEANVFQEQWIAAEDVGQTWLFEFDAKRRDIAGNTTALAFFKTLNPAAGYALTNFITIDMTDVPPTWDSYTLSIAIDASLPGQILQFGFLSTATFYEPSGILYDNVNFRRQPLAVDFDVRPASCPNPFNSRSEGVLPTAVLGTAAFDVGQIDIASLRIEGVAPTKWGFDDVAAPFQGELADGACGCTEAGPDGFLDLELKFDATDLDLAAEDARLTLSGTLLDGTPIEGVDCIVRVGRAPTQTTTTRSAPTGVSGPSTFDRGPGTSAPETVTPHDDGTREREVRDLDRAAPSRRSPTRADR